VQFDAAPIGHLGPEPNEPSISNRGCVAEGIEGAHPIEEERTRHPGVEAEDVVVGVEEEQLANSARRGDGQPFSRASTNCSAAHEVVTLDSGDRGPDKRIEETPVRLYFEQFWHESEGTGQQGSPISSPHAPFSGAVVVQGVVNLGD